MHECMQEQSRREESRAEAIQCAKYIPFQVTMYIQTIPHDVFERLQDLERAAEGWTYPNEQATSDNL